MLCCQTMVFLLGRMHACARAFPSCCVGGVACQQKKDSRKRRLGPVRNCGGECCCFRLLRPTWRHLQLSSSPPSTPPPVADVKGLVPPPPPSHTAAPAAAAGCLRSLTVLGAVGSHCTATNKTTRQDAQRQQQQPPEPPPRLPTPEELDLERFREQRARAVVAAGVGALLSLLAVFFALFLCWRWWGSCCL